MTSMHDSLLLFGVGLFNVLLAVSLAVVRTRPKQQIPMALQASGFEAVQR